MAFRIENNTLFDANVKCFVYKPNAKTLLNNAAPEMLAALELILNDDRLMNAMSREQAQAIMRSVFKANGMGLIYGEEK